jgi:hypothetical protein
MSRVATATAEPPPEPPAPVRRRPRPVLHPFLFTAFPIVFLVARNTTDDIGPWEVFESMGFALAVTAVAFGVLWLILRDPHPAGFLASGLVLLFFSFGHVQDLRDPNHLHPSAHRLLIGYLLLALALILGTVLGTVRWRRAFGRLTPGLNLIAGVLVVMNLVPIVVAGPRGGDGSIGSDVQLAAPAHPRDVYFIIFDRYADEITLRDRFGYDNTPFLASLGDRGFDVVTDAVANYPKTAHSLAATLNMSFLDELVTEEGTNSGNWQPIYECLQDFRAARALQSIGYTYDHIGSWWSPTHDDPTADRNYVYGRGEFSQTLIDTTIWPVLSGTVGISELQNANLAQYRRVAFQFDAIDEIEANPDPTFTFAHFTLPHPPYVFDAQGNYVTPDLVTEGLDAPYLEQLKYTNTAMLQMIDRLLSGPDEDDPIVVIESDEGPHPARLEADEDSFEWPDATDAELGGKFRILDAMYLPGEGPDADLGSFTPVNTFRIVFDRYFGADLPLLPDRSWVFQDSTHPYRFTEITDRLATLQT